VSPKAFRTAALLSTALTIPMLKSVFLSVKPMEQNMLKTFRAPITLLCLFLAAGYIQAQDTGNLKYLGKRFSEIIYVDRAQYVPDHHNTETMFQKGEINEASFAGHSALKAFNPASGKSRMIIGSKDGIVRDPEVSFDGTRILFSMRKNKEDFYHIYEIKADGTDLKQLTFADYVSDIDPLYLPDGSIVFSSTREPKFCMCNRHIMCNLFLMDSDGANIIQLGNSTLHEAHSTLLNDGRILYDRWEYVDRNFGDAQALWTVRPDGTKHSIYYGNNTPSPAAVIDARPIPGSQMIACIFGACHDRPWGALVLLDRRLGVDGIKPVVRIWPANSIGKVAPEGDTRLEDFDAFASIPVKYEDPFPLNENQILVSRFIQKPDGTYSDKMGMYLVDAANNTETLVLDGNLGVFDPQPLCERFKPAILPVKRDFNGSTGIFFVQDVYEGTHMKGIEAGSVKFLRVIESPPKLNWTVQPWGGQGQQAPGMNWTNFENKRILGEIPVEEDGSAYFEVPANKFVYFQLLDKDRKMVQSMRSGTIVQSGEVNGCIGCHDDRLNVPPAGGKALRALQAGPARMNGWNGRAPELFSYMKQVQPIFDNKCVSCHDFDVSNRNKLVLAADNNPFFNASYIDLYVKKKITVAGAGPAAIMQPFSWGSHASLLTRVIDTDHQGVKLTGDEKRTIYTWLDLNAAYYPVYESAYPNNIAGRCPLDDNEMKQLGKLTGIDFWALNDYRRKVGPLISFERPELSPCLDAIRADKSRYDEAVALIAKGGSRLKSVPNGSTVENFVPCEKDRERINRYDFRMAEENRFLKARSDGKKEYDKK
jgi:hypothetical protein